MSEPDSAEESHRTRERRPYPNAEHRRPWGYARGVGCRAWYEHKLSQKRTPRRKCGVGHFEWHPAVLRAAATMIPLDRQKEGGREGGQLVRTTILEHEIGRYGNGQHFVGGNVWDRMWANRGEGKLMYRPTPLIAWAHQNCRASQKRTAARFSRKTRRNPSVGISRM
eukprot:3132754-Rhodomonas_salina.1